MNKYVITGGACTGKTTMINELKRRGFCIIDESARLIIESEQVHAKMNPAYEPIVPWIDNYAFQGEVIKLQTLMEMNATGSRAVLDRSLVDGIAYSKMWGNKEYEGVRDRIKEANYTQVFFLENLGFYEQDDQRKESEEFNQKLHEELYNTYIELGFDVVRVPALPIDERVYFIVKEIGNG